MGDIHHTTGDMQQGQSGELPSKGPTAPVEKGHDSHHEPVAQHDPVLSAIFAAGPHNSATVAYEKLLVLANADIWAAKPGGLATVLKPSLVDVDIALRPAAVTDPAKNGQWQDEERSRVLSVSKELYDRAYLGDWNGVCWPLMHGLAVHVVRKDSQEMRQDTAASTEINKMMAKELADHTRRIPGARIFVHDYHYMECPRMIRELNPDAQIMYFHHTPFCDAVTLNVYDAYEKNPPMTTLKRYVDGLLGSDLVGFQSVADTDKFLGCCEALGGHGQSSVVSVNRHLQTVTVRDPNGDLRKVQIGTFPVSVDYKKIAAEASEKDGAVAVMLNRHGITDETVVSLGVERADYTKGLLQRFEALDRVLTENPSLRGKFVHVQVAAQTRDALGSYKNYWSQLTQLVDRINKEHGLTTSQGTTWSPILLLDAQDHKTVAALHRRADVGIANSLADGFNLFPSESASVGSTAWLLVGRGAGASHVFENIRIQDGSVQGGAIIVDGAKIEEIAQQWTRCLLADRDDPERLKRAAACRHFVERYDCKRWTTDLNKACALAIAQRRNVGSELPH